MCRTPCNRSWPNKSHIGRFCKFYPLVCLPLKRACTVTITICATIAINETAWCNPPGPKSEGTGAGKQESDKSKDKKRYVDGPFPEGSSEEELAELLGDKYKSLHTDHFAVLYYANPKVVRSFVPRLERTFESVLRFADQLGIDVEYDGDKLPVVFCRTRDEYALAYQKITRLNQAPSERSVGRYIGSANACIFYDISDFKEVREFIEKARKLQEEAKRDSNPKSRAKKLRMASRNLNRASVHKEDQNRTAVQHEVAHQLLYNFGVHNAEGRHHNPQWLVEGLAMLFEPPPGDMGAGFSVVNQRRLGIVRDKVDSLTAADWRNLIAPASASQGMLTREGYGQTWALTYYLTKRKSKPLQQYLLAIRERSPTILTSPTERLEEFQEFFGEVDERFARTIAGFVKKLPHRPD